MQITKVHLRNIKSYVDAEIAFTPGTNAISGENGAGKTTILQSIGYALFDSLDLKQDEFLRQGTKAGSIEVYFIGEDGREYTITRKLGKSEYYVYDPKSKMKLASGVEDVTSWIKKNLRIDEDRDLKRLFTEAIGVPQGLFVAPFLDTPRNRKQTFDGILEVDDYSEAYSYMRSVESLVKERISVLETEIAELEGRCANFDDENKRLNELDNEILNEEKEHEFVVKELEECKSERDRLEKIAEKKNELENKLKQHEKEIIEKEKHLNSLKEMVLNSEKARMIVEKTKSAYSEYLKLEQEKETVEKLLEVKRRAEKELANVDKEIASIGAEQKSHFEMLEKIDDAKRQMDALKDDVAKQNELENKVRELEKNAAVLRSLKDAHVKDLHELEDTRGVISELEKKVVGLDSLESEVSKMGMIETEREKISNEIAACRAEIAKMNENKRKLKGGICPIIGDKCPCVGNDVDTFFAEKISELKKNEDRLLAEYERIKKEHEKCKRTREMLEEKKREVTKLTMMKEREKTLESKIAKNTEKIRELERITQELPGQRDALTKLGNPKEEYNKLAGIASREREVKEKISRCAERKEKSLQKRDKLAKELERFKETNEKFENIKKRMSELRADYTEYQMHLRDSERLEERKDAVLVVETALKNTRDLMNRISNDLNELKKTFSDDNLVNARKIYEEISNKCARIETRISELKRVRNDISNRISELVKVKEKIEEKKNALKNEMQLKEFIEYLRRIINEASPLITAAYMNRLSRDANKLYRALTGNEACELIWDKDYEIVIRERGLVKNFKQLSGGQQMAAALSARLSLLKNISELGIAFFDEPTQNLDKERRENLADALSNISGFTQLFVISHDDTFDQKVQNSIRLELVDGETKVVR